MKEQENHSEKSQFDEHSPKPKQLSPTMNYIAGLGAGLISTAIGYPLDVARVRFLFGGSTRNLTQGFMFTFMYSIGKNGLVWPIQKDLHNSIEQNVKSIVGYNLLGSFLSGAFGNLIPGIIFNPCNVVKVRYMESHNPTSLKRILWRIRHQEGYHVFSKGIFATVMRDGLWGMIYFPLFLHLKSVLEHRNSQNQSNILSKEFVRNVIASATAAGSATLLSSFLDSVRLFQQKTHDLDKIKKISLQNALKMSLTPNKRNIASVITGVGRVTITTCFGHLTFIAISQAAENR